MTSFDPRMGKTEAMLRAVVVDPAEEILVICATHQHARTLAEICARWTDGTLDAATLTVTRPSGSRVQFQSTSSGRETALGRDGPRYVAAQRVYD